MLLYLARDGWLAHLLAPHACGRPSMIAYGARGGLLDPAHSGDEMAWIGWDARSAMPAKWVEYNALVWSLGRTWAFIW